MKIGFFGGTFDPIHFGHINLAIQLLESHRLDQVLFCPAGQSPFKEHRPPIASSEDRLSMVQLAIEDIPAFHLCKIEVFRSGLSYTIDTLRTLKESLSPNTQLYILLSADVLSSFHQWKEPQGIIQLASPLIGSRCNHPIVVPPSSVRAALLEGLTETRQFEISSTEIRERLSKKLYCGHLLPHKVLSYINKHSLYLK